MVEGRGRDAGEGKGRGTMEGAVRNSGQNMLPLFRVCFGQKYRHIPCTCSPSLNASSHLTVSKVPELDLLAPGRPMMLVALLRSPILRIRPLRLHNLFIKPRFLGLCVTMPPKRTASKRKIESDNDESDKEEGASQVAQSSKKPRNEKKTTPENTQPTNKTLPVSIVIAPKAAGTTRIVSWNVSGYAASSKKACSFTAALQTILTIFRASPTTSKQKMRIFSS